MKRNIAVLAAAALLVAGTAFAQTYSVPQVSTTHSGDLIPVLPNGNPSVGNKYATRNQITNSGSYSVNPAVDGTHNSSLYAYTFGNNTAQIVFTPSATISYAYVTFAAAPSDGQKACTYSTSAITLFYPTANTGQTVQDAATTLGALGHLCYQYGASNATWYRIE